MDGDSSLEGDPSEIETEREAFWLLPINCRASHHFFFFFILEV